MAGFEAPNDISKRQITDSGLGEKMQLSRRNHQIIDAMADEYEDLKRHIKTLERLGVTVVERSFGDPLQAGEPYEFQAKTKLVGGACLHALKIGWYLRSISDLMWEAGVASMNEPRRKKAGKAGGDAVREPAQKRHRLILNEYKAWAGTEDNGESVPAFAKQLEQTMKRRKKLRGFSQKTIERTVHTFHDEVRRLLQSQALPHSNARKRNAVIAERMKDHSGVSIETVRRALA